MTRPKNLEAMRSHVARGAEAPGLNLKWYIIHDAREAPEQMSMKPDWVFEDSCFQPGTAGKSQVNYALVNYIEGNDTFVWVLDDDNIPHPNFFDAMRDLAATHPQAYGFVFDQELELGNIRSASQCSMRPGHIDQAQYVWHERCRRGILIPECYIGDGLFAEALYAAHPDRWVFVNSILSYYNYLRRLPTDET